VTGTAVTSSSNPAVGTQVSATASCAAGKVLLGGGAQVTATGGQQARVVLTSSYPSSTTVWTAQATVITALSGSGAGNTVTVTPYALCSQ